MASANSTAQNARDEVQEFFKAKEGSALTAWLHHFDTNNDCRITTMEFARGMRTMGYPGNATALFASLDSDGSGELSLEEIDEADADLWQRFRVWCVAAFGSVKDMIAKLRASKTKGIAPDTSRLGSGRHSTATPSPTPTDVSIGSPRQLMRMKTEQIDDQDSCNLEQFKAGVNRKGWEGGFEELLFEALDGQRSGRLGPQDLRWLDTEKKRLERKTKAKNKALLVECRHRSHDHITAMSALRKFRQFLKRHYGEYIRAWRNVLSPSGAMMLSKLQFFMACAEIGFRSEAKLLWQAFGKEEYDFLTLEELDPKSAIILAQFQRFITEQFGGAATAFRALDKLNRRMLPLQEFISALKTFGFQSNAKLLFHGLDHNGRRHLVAEDLLFLDRWKPPPFLLATPCTKAMAEVKSLFIKAYGGYLKAWRKVLDVDNSNRCSWSEFQAGCAKLGFQGDAPGAWRALDRGFAGFITLKDIDAVAAEFLDAFRTWARKEFGSVVAAFGVFGADGSDSASSVSSREFSRACRFYGYRGNAMALFKALDVERDGSLTIKEVAFLDAWEIDDGQDEVVEEAKRSHPSAGGRQTSGSEAAMPTPSPRAELEDTIGSSQTFWPQQSASGSTPWSTLQSHRPHTAPEPLTNQLSSTLESTTRSSYSPRLRPGHFIPVPAMWCQLCQARGPCRHLTYDRRARSATPSEPAPVVSFGASLLTPSLPSSGPSRSSRSRMSGGLTVGELRSLKAGKWSEWAWSNGSVYGYKQTAVPLYADKPPIPKPPRVDPVFEEYWSKSTGSSLQMPSLSASPDRAASRRESTSSRREWSSGAEIQCMALRQFPMGCSSLAWNASSEVSSLARMPSSDAVLP